MGRNKIVTLILVIAMLTGLAGCGTKDAAEMAVVGTWKTAQTIQPFLYGDYIDDQQVGYIEVKPFTNPGDMKAALLAGSLDMCGTTLVTAITAASKGEPIMIVSGLANRCSALVAGTDSGIEVEADLKWKRIAYVPGTMHHLLLLEVLGRNGLDPVRDVELIRIDFFDMGQALAEGKIDAFYSGEPYPSIAVKEGYGRVLAYPNDDGSIGTINAAMMTTRDVIEEKPEVIQSLVSAHVKATQHLNDDRAGWLDKAADFGTDRQVLDAAADNMDLFYNIDEDYIAHVRHLAERMKEQGLIDNVPDIDGLFDLGFLEHAYEKI